MTIETDSGSEQGNASQSLDDIINTSIEEFSPDADEDNRFETTAEVSAEDKPQGNEEPESDESDIPENDDAIEAEESDETTDILSAPKHWPADRKAVFDTLPEEAKQAWLAQAKDAERGLSQQGEKFAEQRKNWEAVEDVLKPFDGQLSQMGLSKPQAVAKLVQLYQGLKSDPKAHIQWVMQQARLNPEQLFSQGQQEDTSEEEWMDPTVRQLKTELDAVKQKNATIEQAMQQAWQAGQVERTAAHINGLAQETDAEGNPVYPHFNDEMSVEMADIIEQNSQMFQAISDPTQKFQMAYNMAVGRNHKKYVEAELEQRLSQQQSEKAKKARTIRPNYGSQGSTVRAGQDLDAIIADSLSKHGL